MTVAMQQIKDEDDWYTDEDTAEDIAEMEAITDGLLAVSDFGLEDWFAELVEDVA